MKGIIHYQTEEYGCIKVKLSGVLKSLGITRNQLRTLTGVKYEVIDRYYKGEDIYMADLNFLAKVNEDRAESPGTPQFQGFPHNLKTWVSLCFPFYPERLLM